MGTRETRTMGLLARCRDEKEEWATLWSWLAARCDWDADDIELLDALIDTIKIAERIDEMKNEMMKPILSQKESQ